MDMRSVCAARMAEIKAMSCPNMAVTRRWTDCLRKRRVVESSIDFALHSASAVSTSIAMYRK